MTESSAGDRLEEGLQAAQAITPPVPVVRTGQTAGFRQEMFENLIEGIIQRLQDDPKLKAKVMARIKENEAKLLTVERRERIFRLCGIELKRTEESVRHHV